MGMCLECHSKNTRKRNKLTRPIYKERLKERKLFLVNLKGNKCAICNQSYPLPCYDFHHRDPSLKDRELYHILKSNQRKDNWLEDVLEEVNKCDLLCSNCHRIVHFSGGINGKHTG
jgi:hypothetical protein